MATEKSRTRFGLERVAASAVVAVIGMEGRFPREILEGLEMALQVCHEDRSMSYEQAGRITKTASWLKEKLVQELSVSEEDMAKLLRIYELLKAVKDKSPGLRKK